jgi:hypothetical protein
VKDRGWNIVDFTIVGAVIGEWEKPLGFNEAKLGFSKLFMADWCFFVHLELMFFL